MLAKLSMRLPVRRCAVIGAAGLALLGTGLPAAATEGPGPGLDRFYDQRITWSACEGADLPEDLQCGKITVPVDYAEPGRGTLELALARYPGTGNPAARWC